MVLGARVRKAALTAHVIASVGWLGAVACVLVLAVTGMSSRNAETARAAYLAMDVTAWRVLVPLAVASFLTGITQSLVTKWGLLLHYWVVVKLWITVIATAVLVLYTETLKGLADIARRSSESGAIATELQQPTVVLHAALALALLVGATVLAVFKPAGLTRRGRRV